MRIDPAIMPAASRPRWFSYEACEPAALVGNNKRGPREGPMTFMKPSRRRLTRRDAMKTAGAAAVAASVGPFFHVSPARAARTLKILQWSHFVPGYDKWFNNEDTKEWG